MADNIMAAKNNDKNMADNIMAAKNNGGLK